MSPDVAVDLQLLDHFDLNLVAKEFVDLDEVVSADRKFKRPIASTSETDIGRSVA